ncbi:hypothetical protein ACFFQF_04785 [Haladaptatus pallidirubidus]|uniref:Uncharacterized protein n=1 Tax=Haladaptatus pallidirubidus TaxID=1008152 RepID=A0AAV3UL25_9EURY|nr:hypothetical protein [Haladaptatus pallidirubidus]
MTNSALDERTGDDKREVVFAIDETPDERCPDRAIIADITQDDVWLAVDLPDALMLEEWR